MICTNAAIQPGSGQSARKTANPRVRSFDIAGQAGRLEAVLNEGGADVRFTALVCHPHPLGGGNLHNKVVYHAMKILNDPRWGFSLPVLRFNFRGTGTSEGLYDGEAEAQDVLTALGWLEHAYGLPVLAAGFSFGAAMTIAACCSQAVPARVKALIALGLPLDNNGRAYAYPMLSGCTLPKLFLSGDRDQFAPADALRQTIATAANPKQLTLVPGADHFFTGHLPAMQSSLAAWLKEQLS
jgi:alpha/beta superfamily hydrolase